MSRQSSNIPVNPDDMLETTFYYRCTRCGWISDETTKDWSGKYTWCIECDEYAEQQERVAKRFL